MSPSDPSAAVVRPSAFAVFAVAWRNLGRNRRRTALTASAIGFATMLMVFVTNMQTGTYASMVNNATKLLVGHMQVQDVRYEGDPRIRYTIENSDARVAALGAVPGVRLVTQRASGFAVIAGEDSSFGGQVLGVDAQAEAAFSLLPQFIHQGRYLSGAPGEVVLGDALARNIGVQLGDDVVILGATPDGGVAASGATLVGLIKSDTPEIDRSLAQIPLGDFREAFALGDASHSLVLTFDDAYQASAQQDLVHAAARIDDANLVVLDWKALLPEVEQMVELDRVFGVFVLLLLGLMVTFSIANTFMMMVFERTKEFGMLLAIGTRPGFIIALLQLEAVMLCGLGVVVGTGLGVLLSLVVGEVGIPIDEMGAELLRQYHMPDRLYPGFAWHSLLMGPPFMFFATQFAALLPALRLRNLEPVAAQRD